jgi:hypothetical protein
MTPILPKPSLNEFIRMSRPRRDPGLSVEPFSFSQTTYNDVVDAFRIPATFLSLVASHTTLVTTYELSDTGYGIFRRLLEVRRLQY